MMRGGQKVSESVRRARQGGGSAAWPVKVAAKSRDVSTTANVRDDLTSEVIRPNVALRVGEIRRHRPRLCIMRFEIFQSKTIDLDTTEHTAKVAVESA